MYGKTIDTSPRLNLAASPSRVAISSSGTTAGCRSDWRMRISRSAVIGICRVSSITQSGARTPSFSEWKRIRLSATI